MMEFIKRCSLFMVGLTIVSIGLVLTIKADLGVAPWDVFHIGLTNHFSLTVGQANQITGIVIILISFLIARIRPTLGTVINMLYVGFMIDMFILLVPEPTFILWRYLYLFLGIIIFGTGAGMYIVGRFGTGPRDSLMMALDDRLNVGISWIRGTMEVSILIVGYFLGGPVGVGTVFTALGIGPIVGKSLQVIDDLMNG